MLDLRIKDLFFDRPAVQEAVDKARRGVLSRIGAFVRQAVRSSIRPRKGTSLPGQPPHSHTGRLRRWILFGYDPQSDSVVVGPVGFDNSPAPAALEHGGPSRMKDHKGRTRTIRVAARPFMGPAMKNEVSKLPKLWAESVRK